MYRATDKLDGEMAFFAIDEARNCMYVSIDYGNDAPWMSPDKFFSGGPYLPSPLEWSRIGEDRQLVWEASR